MRTIILFNDNSPEAENAGRLALEIAEKAKADLLVLNLCADKKTMSRQKALAGSLCDVAEKAESFDKINYLADGRITDDFEPVVDEIDASSYTEKEIYELVIRKNSWMMIKGIETHVTHEVLSGIDVQTVINHVACPLLLVPDNYAKNGFENITYALDMRYCRTAVLRYLAELANMYNANLSVEHFSAKGLPHLGDDFASDLFEGGIASKIKYDRIYFNNLKERDLGVAVDVMVSDLHADLLALVNHRFHFEELFGRTIKNVLPEHIPVPVIIFPL
jgi:hypothetical protein